MRQSWLARFLARNDDVSEAFLSADLRELRPVEVNFGNWVELAGAALERDVNGLTLKLHWRLLRRTTRPWRCFVHVLAGGKQVSSLDHDVLRGRPAITRWEQGDEGYERLRLWLADAPDDLRLRLGIYDPEINVRCPVLVSTLPVEDESTAVTMALNPAEGAAYIVCFEPVPLEPCRIVFEGGLELTAYSVVRYEELIWLRLKWTVRQGGRRGLRFFGHAVPEQHPETPAVAQFDQDVAIERRGPATMIEQNVVRAVAGHPAWLRAGLFRPSNLERLRILSGTVEVNEKHRCAYLPIATRKGSEVAV